MQMTEGEIFRSYKEAKNPKEQIKVLAELNAVPKEIIVDILKKQGVDGRLLPHPRRPKKEEPKPISQSTCFCSPKTQKAREQEVDMHRQTDALYTLRTLTEALELYKRNTMDALEKEIDKAEETFVRIEAALAYVRGQVEK